MILKKILKIAATRCHILRLKCTEFDFGWGSAPDPTGELAALPLPMAQTPIADLGPYFYGEGRKGGKGKGGEDRDEENGNGGPYSRTPPTF